MFQYLESKTEIERAQRALEATIRQQFPHRAIRDIGYPGGRVRGARVFTDRRHWFWSRDIRGNARNPRRLYWFGIFKEAPGFGITVEVNTTFKGRNDQVAGFFARDTDTGIAYLMHTGRVGGGTKGVGKNAFLTWATLTKRPLIDVIDASGNIRRGLVVMPINGPFAVRSAARYIDIVREFKSAARAGKLLTRTFRQNLKKFEDYYSEWRGHRRIKLSNEIEYVSRHGEIVDALHAWRKARPRPTRSRIVKNTLIDMGLAVGSRLLEVFEVKPKTDRSSVYSALGQVMVHGGHNACKRIIVIPQDGKLPEDVAKALQRLKIELLKFKLTDSNVRIIG